MQDKEEEMREEATEVHEEVQEGVQKGRKEESAAVPDDLLQSRLPHLNEGTQYPESAFGARRSCA